MGIQGFSWLPDLGLVYLPSSIDGRCLWGGGKGKEWWTKRRASEALKMGDDPFVTSFMGQLKCANHNLTGRWTGGMDALKVNQNQVPVAVPSIVLIEVEQKSVGTP